MQTKQTPPTPANSNPLPPKLQALAERMKADPRLAQALLKAARAAASNG